VPIARRLVPGRDGRQAWAKGGLSGKSVYLSPGHGWTYSTQGWNTQRPNSHGLVEDLSNADGIDWFLVPYLLGAGALVVPVREIDPNPNMVIIDNGDGSQNPARGRYVESGDTTAFLDSTLAGWGHPSLPLTGLVNPFKLGGNRLMKTAPKETARATFVPNVPENGFYNVHISYSMFSARASDAKVTVAHPGGETRFEVDQRRHGSTWVLLGRFYFEKGANEKRGAVYLTNESQDADTNVSVDAVRLGGGVGLIDRGGGTSQQPRADECSRYHAQFAGAPAEDVYETSGDDHTDDVGTRSRFADWVHAPGEPAVYISHHTNAFNGEARGTRSFVYGKNPVDGNYQPTPETLALGSDKLAKAVHDEVGKDLKAAWDPNWNGGKVTSAYFGELNTANQDEMASMLIETAFHDQVDDAAALKEAAFRVLVARAIYKGIVKYFAAEEGAPVRLLPEPPRAVIARNTAPGEVTVSWEAPPSGGVFGDPATSYRVERSAGGYGFDEGTDSGGKTTLTLKGLTPGQVLYLRVTAVNEGGRSLPSPTLAVGVAAGGRAPLLLVTGDTRFDASMNLKLDYPKVKTVDRLLVDHIQNGTYLVQHGAALGPSGVPFDACLHGAVDAGSVRLSDYSLVLWQGGRGLKSQQALSPKSRDALAEAAKSGVSLIMSGSHLARWLGGTGAAPEDRAFLENTLHASFVEAVTSHVDVSPESGTLEGLQPWRLSTWKTGPYEVGVPDVIKPAGSATLLAGYGSNLGGEKGAVTQQLSGGRCTVLLGHPLEAIVPAARQAEILTRLLKLCDVKVPDGGIPWGDGWRDGGLPKPAGDGAAEDDDGCGCALWGTPRRPMPLLGVLIVILGLAWRRKSS
jgi:N-acetylmuramoyl-L-alanine amidase